MKVIIDSTKLEVIINFLESESEINTTTAIRMLKDIQLQKKQITDYLDLKTDKNARRKTN